MRHRRDPPHDGNLLTDAINTSTGQLTEALLHLLALRRKRAGDAWDGLPTDYQARWLGSLDLTTQHGRFVICLLASRLHFLYGVDARWTLETLLPFLNRDSEPQASAAAWHGYLTWGRWNPAMLPVLLPLYSAAFNRLTDDLAPVADRMADHLAGICAYAPESVQPGWLDAFLGAALEDHRADWTRRVRRLVAEAASAERDAVWDAWMKDYWSRRLTGVPVPLAGGEIEHLFSWVLLQDPANEEAVQLAESTPLRVEGHTYLIHELGESSHTTSHPAHAARIMMRVLQGAETPFYLCAEAARLVEALIQAGAPRPLLRLLCERLSQLGCGEGGDLMGGLE